MASQLAYGEIPSFLEKNCVIKSTAAEVLKNLRDNYEKFGKVTDQDLLDLSSIFGETLEKALELIEDNKVTYYHTASDIGVYQIEGNSNKIYTIFPLVNYCPCQSYKYQVSGGSQILCKHVLATLISSITNKRHSIEVSEEHLNDLLLKSVSLNYKMNDREDWQNRNAYMEQFVYPGIQPSFGINSQNWAHVPPQTMPWGLPPESHPSIVRFTAGDFNPHSVSVKRKFDSSVDMPPSKMLVTEEKMAAHMRSLHISDVDPPEVPSIKEEPMETERLPRLVISDEIKNLKTDSLIPDSILKKLEKPEMALVLWQPPAADLGSKLRELKKLSLMKNKEKKKEKKENKEEKEMEVEETEGEINPSNNSIFKPIDPVSTPQYFQSVPQPHGYSPFS